MVSPTLSTSPPSSVPGAWTRFTEQRMRLTAASTPGVSGLRESAPGRVTSATFLYITTVSSTKTASGQSSAGSTSAVSQPCSSRAAT